MFLLSNVSDFRRYSQNTTQLRTFNSELRFVKKKCFSFQSYKLVGYLFKVINWWILFLQSVYPVKTKQTNMCCCLLDLTNHNVHINIFYCLVGLSSGRNQFCGFMPHKLSLQPQFITFHQQYCHKHGVSA